MSMSRQKLSILHSPSKPFYVFLSLFQLPRNHYAESQVLSYVMPTADESNHSATGTLHPHHRLCSATCVLYITLLTLHCPLKKKEICPFPNWRYKPQCSHWNNGKMKIACNSAYVQTETLNFTFARQAIIVYFYNCCNCCNLILRNGYAERQI